MDVELRESREINKIPIYSTAMLYSHTLFVVMNSKLKGKYLLLLVIAIFRLDAVRIFLFVDQMSLELLGRRIEVTVWYCRIVFIAQYIVDSGSIGCRLARRVLWMRANIPACRNSHVANLTVQLNLNDYYYTLNPQFIFVRLEALDESVHADSYHVFTAETLCSPLSIFHPAF